MQFEYQVLRDVLGRTSNQIELRDVRGRRYGTLSATDALKHNLDEFVGIGNLRRIRFLRSRTQRFPLNAGSRTTQRLKGAFGVNIAHPLIREHRSVL